MAFNLALVLVAILMEVLTGTEGVNQTQVLYLLDCFKRMLLKQICLFGVLGTLRILATTSAHVLSVSFVRGFFPWTRTKPSSVLASVVLLE